MRGWAQSAWTVGDSTHDLPQSPVGPASSLSVLVHLSFCLSTGSRPGTGRKQQPAECPLPGSSILYAQALLLSLEFPERQKSGKAHQSIPVRASETREVQQIAEGHTENHAHTGSGPWVGLLSPLTTLSSKIMGM